MNRLIKGLDYNKLVFLDLEMATQEKELPSDGELYKTFAYKQRNRETDEIPDFDVLQDLYKRKAALSPIYGMVTCATVGQVRNNKIVLKTYSEGEKVILEGLIEVLSKNGYIPVTFNGLEFDLPFARKRACLHGLDFPEHLNDVGKKPWDMDKVQLDIFKLHKGTNWYMESLAELCYMYGIKSPKILNENPNVVYWRDGIKPIIEYNQGDVRALINLFRVMKGDKIIE